ncbi:hypothetical protein LTR28_012452, partial [Elasticomyces elasticus]
MSLMFYQTLNNRRSRSPNVRGGNAPAGVDRYVSGQGQSRRNERGQQNGRDNRRGRDDYRPRSRSSSPRGGRSGRGRDRSADRYDGRYRSRSRSPYGRGARHRSPSPRNIDDDLPLPKRAPLDVPEVQIMVLDDLDRNFIAWIESAFHVRNIRVDVLILSPRLSEAAVIRRQIIEGVAAVVRLTRSSEATAKIPLQIFDRGAGVDNVRYEEYNELDPGIAAELVIRARQTHAAPPPQIQTPIQYGY